MSESQRIYRKVKNSWVYVVKIPTNLYYVGKSSKKRVCDRLSSSNYDNTALNPYISQYGWDNLDKLIVIDNLTEDEALVIEDKLICLYRNLGCCVNMQRSGNRTKMDDYKHIEYIEHADKYKTRAKKYREEHLEEVKEKKHEYYLKNADYIKEKRKKDYYNNLDKINETRRKPENLIYTRVKNYNRYHQIIETPLEAKRKYLETGYIPDYIKNDDLFVVVTNSNIGVTMIE